MKRTSVVLACAVALGLLGLGCKGDKGDTGAQGPAGADGPQGPAGPAGPLPSVSTGGGLTGTGATGSPLAVDFGGTGASSQAARADHVHVATNYGKLTVYHGVVDTVTVPWTNTQATALIGQTLTWPADGPNLRDTASCSPAYRVDNTVAPGWTGVYTVTFMQCNGTNLCIQGSWYGWELRLFNASDTVVAGPSFSRVDFTLYYNSGWRIEHMAGYVGSTVWECH